MIRTCFAKLGKMWVLTRGFLLSVLLAHIMFYTSQNCECFTKSGNFVFFFTNFGFSPSLLCSLPLFRLLCRLTYALCLNFLAIIHLDGHVTQAVEKVETSFTKVKILLSLYLVSSINIITGI